MPEPSTCESLSICICEAKKKKRGSSDKITHGFRCKNAWHRSVAISELAATAFRDDGYHVTVEHREENVAKCGCPNECARLATKQWTDAKQEATRKSWAADGFAAHVLASRLYYAC